MVRVFIFLAAIALILGVLALISCLSADRARVRGMPRWAWVAVILLLPVLGPAAWFAAGRPKATDAPGRPAAAPQRRGPAAPDDDPDFLRSLDAERSRRDSELFNKWEADLRKREDELRRRDNGDTPRRGNEEVPPSTDA